MTYHTETQVRKVQEMENHVHMLHKQMRAVLDEADVLIAELREAHGLKFVVNGTPFVLRHAATGYGFPGNRNWLTVDEHKIIGPGD